MMKIDAAKTEALELIARAICRSRSVGADALQYDESEQTDFDREVPVIIRTVVRQPAWVAVLSEAEAFYNTLLHIDHPILHNFDCA